MRIWHNFSLIFCQRCFSGSRSRCLRYTSRLTDACPLILWWDIRENVKMFFAFQSNQWEILDFWGKHNEISVIETPKSTTYEQIRYEYRPAHLNYCPVEEIKTNKQTENLHFHHAYWEWRDENSWTIVVNFGVNYDLTTAINYAKFDFDTVQAVSVG